jgi:hypothetical protein
VTRVERDPARSPRDRDDLDHPPAGRVDDADVVGALAGRDRPEEPSVGRHRAAGREVAERHLGALRRELAAVEQEAGGGIGRVGRRRRRGRGDTREDCDERHREGKSAYRHRASPLCERIVRGAPAARGHLVNVFHAPRAAFLQSRGASPATTFHTAHIGTAAP